MFKELILAIILGGLLGFGITGGYLAVKKDKTKTNPITENKMVTVSSIPTHQAPSPTSFQKSPDNEKGTTKHQITIDSPENESVFSNSLITIKGVTSAESQIIITTPSKNFTTMADKAGNFSQEIEIDSGANFIQITSIDSDDNQASSLLLVTYSTAKF